ncbi:MAG TPA: glutamate-5-semialdehyde dehydrogenase [Abditibacteriaceae bacterium]|jgi:glutamate-5-semialdehyde dehydrogenase
MSAVTTEVVNQANGHLNGSATLSESAGEDAVRAQVHDKAMRARQAAAPLRTLSTEIKNHALLLMADKLVQRAEEIISANERDIEAGRARGLSEAMLDRLRLNPKRIEDMADGCRQVAALPDPIGQVIGGGPRPNGLRVERLRVPLGVIGIIYESRPTVTVDAAILCLKSGNAVILRGGSEAIHSNLCLAQIIEEAAREAGAPADCIQLIETTDRAATTHLAQMNGLVDLIIPRGGEGLKKALSKIATVPMIFAAGGICHVFLDESADLQDALEITFNAKVQRPSTCNALETLLVHEKIADRLLPPIAGRLQEAGVELRGDQRVRALVPMNEATDEDWDAEYNALILSIAVVDNLDEALAHIAQHGTGHSESIVTQNYANAEKFLAQVDAAAVYVNASTRFTDGFEFGLGAEVGISTQKLHARGPMGLEALTSTKFVVRGDGHIRQ